MNSALPEQRVVVRFDVSDDRNKRHWMLYQRPEPEACVRNPGLNEDLIVTTDSVTLTDVHTGRLGVAQAARLGRFSIAGPRDLAGTRPSWGERLRHGQAGQSPRWRLRGYSGLPGKRG